MKFDTSDKILLYLATTKDENNHTIWGIAANTKKKYCWTRALLKELRMKGWIYREPRTISARRGPRPYCYFLTESGLQYVNENLKGRKVNT